MPEIIIDEWKGMYPSQWKGLVVPETFKHPARYSSRLIARIYKHMLEEGWLKPGDVVIDPFGGVALGALEAMRRGLRWRGVELEQHYVDPGNQNIALWNSRYTSLPGWCSDAILYQGDSRYLLEVLQTADGSVASPPYAELGHRGGRDDTHPEKIQGGKYRTIGLDGSVASPPYADSIERPSGIDPDKSENVSGPNSQMNHDTQYGSTAGQLGAMKVGSLDGAIASPPFRQTRGGDPEPKAGGAINAALKERHAAGNADKKAYGENDGQLANMSDGDFDGVLSSPPYEGLRMDGGLAARENGYGGLTPYSGERADTWITKRDPTNLGNNVGDDFWMAARAVIEQTFLALCSGGHAAWVVKHYVKDDKLVDFPGQWRQLCEAVGFVAIHEHHATLIKHKTRAQTLDGKTLSHTTESKSFFRRNIEKQKKAKKFWGESGLTEDSKMDYLQRAEKIKWDNYNEDIQSRPNLRPPTKTTILGKAQIMAYDDAGTPEIALSTAIDYEVVYCMRKP